MSGTRGRLGRLGRPGLTLPELLGAIALLGVTGSLLLPRLTPSQPPTYHRDSYIGIGAAFDSHNRTWDGYPRIHRPFRDSPAAEAGIRPSDAVVTVDGVSTREEPLDTIVGMIRGGAEGTPVELTVRHSDSDSDQETITIIRQRIMAPTRRDAWGD